jgi:hypothetical protein
MPARLCRNSVRWWRNQTWRWGLFCSSEYGLDVLAAGLRDHSLAGASFPASHYSVATGHVDHLQQFNVNAGQDFAQALLQKLQAESSHSHADNSFALLLIDGLSLREESVTRAFQTSLG